MQVPVGGYRRGVTEPTHQVLDRRARGGRQRLAGVAQVMEPETPAYQPCGEPGRMPAGSHLPASDDHHGPQTPGPAPPTGCHVLGQHRHNMRRDHHSPLACVRLGLGIERGPAALKSGACGAAGPASAPRSALGGPRGARRASPHARRINTAHSERNPEMAPSRSFPASQPAVIGSAGPVHPVALARSLRVGTARCNRCPAAAGYRWHMAGLDGRRLSWRWAAVPALALAVTGCASAASPSSHPPGASNPGRAGSDRSAPRNTASPWCSAPRHVSWPAVRMSTCRGWLPAHSTASTRSCPARRRPSSVNTGPGNPSDLIPQIGSRRVHHPHRE